MTSIVVTGKKTHMAKRFTTIGLAASLIACSFVLQSPAMGQEAGSLPGGASSLEETYQDWRLVCRVADEKKQCGISQQQTRKDGQRMLTIELHNGPDNILDGNLVLPFGLLFDTGVTIQIDEQAAKSPLSFRTCLLAGCIVPLTFEDETITALRSGTALKAQVKTADGRGLAFSISLKGLSAALDRIDTLLNG